MAIQFTNVEPSWSNILSTLPPVPVGELNQQQVGKEIRVRWGTNPWRPGNVQSGYGFLPLVGPIRYIREGEKFRLGRLRHFNHPITSLTGRFLGSIDLDIHVDFARGGEADFTIAFTHNETPNAPGPPLSDDHVTFTTALPIVLSHEGIVIHIMGFENEDGEQVSQFDSPEGTVNTAYLIAKLIDDGIPDVACTDDNRVFNPAKCSVPCVEPILEQPILADCTIPGGIDPITSCPDINIPMAHKIDVLALISNQTNTTLNSSRVAKTRAGGIDGLSTGIVDLARLIPGGCELLTPLSSLTVHNLSVEDVAELVCIGISYDPESEQWWVSWEDC